jgi:hypothetical protein
MIKADLNTVNMQGRNFCFLMVNRILQLFNGFVA